MNDENDKNISCSISYENERQGIEIIHIHFLYNCISELVNLTSARHILIVTYLNILTHYLLTKL